MKILFVIHSLNIGGAETVVTEYLLNMKEKGHDVILLQIQHFESFLYQKLCEKGVPVYSVYPQSTETSLLGKLKQHLSLKLLQRKKVEKAIQQINPDVIHFQTSLAYMHQLNINFHKVAYTFHTTVQRTFQLAKGFKKAFVNCCKKGIRVIAISHIIRNGILEVAPNSNVILIPNGIDTETISLSKINRTLFCESLSIPTDSFLMGHVGRFHPVKNHEKLIDVFAKVHYHNKKSILLLIGDGEEERLRNLQSRIESYGLTQSVYFLGMRSDAKSVMSVFDCFVLPSHTEGFPLVLAEAQVHGIRCVASSVVPDEIIIRNNCFKLDIESSDETWADYILGDFVRDSDGSINTIDINTVVDQHIDIYRQMIENDI